MSGDVDAAAETVRNYLDHWVNHGHLEAVHDLDALVAEVEQLRAEMKAKSEAAWDRITKLHKEGDQLRAERDAYHEQRDEWAGRVGVLQEQAAGLRAERDAERKRRIEAGNELVRFRHRRRFGVGL